MPQLSTDRDPRSPQQQPPQRGQGRRSSRIPVHSKYSQSRQRGPLHQHSSTSSAVRSHALGPGAARRVGTHDPPAGTWSRIDTRSTERVLARAASPPVPALAKQLQQHERLDRHQDKQHEAQHQGTWYGAQHQDIRPHHQDTGPTPVPTTLSQRAQSPPVPALAKKLKHAATADGTAANLPLHQARDPPPPLHLPPVQSDTGRGHIAASSPPPRPAQRKEETRLPPLVSAREEKPLPEQGLLKQLLQLRKVRKPIP